MKNYNYIGLPIAKAYQMISVIFSVFVLIIAVLITNYLAMLLFFIAIAVLINGLWYIFSNIKFNSDFFYVEKFLWKKRLPSSEFIKVEKIILNFYYIKFIHGKYYFFGDLKSIFNSGDHLNDAIKKAISV